ncbi:MAG: hypothetical protein K2G25_07095 [Oscillospiraceae bacterium]|nr:hypothetical protein [Oscillospiraceae bacterium]
MIFYREFFIRLTPEILMRQDEKGNADVCDGFLIEILDIPDSPVPLEIISAATGYELLENSEKEVAEFVKEYLDDIAVIYRS